MTTLSSLQPRIVIVRAGRCPSAPLCFERQVALAAHLGRCASWLVRGDGQLALKTRGASMADLRHQHRSLQRSVTICLSHLVVWPRLRWPRSRESAANEIDPSPGRYESSRSHDRHRYPASVREPVSPHSTEPTMLNHMAGPPHGRHDGVKIQVSCDRYALRLISTSACRSQTRWSAPGPRPDHYRRPTTLR